MPFDTTVGELDAWTYYTETRDGGAPATLPSDFFLSQYGETRDSWNVYSVSQEAWVKDYVDGYVASTISAHLISHMPPKSHTMDVDYQSGIENILMFL